MGAVGGLLCVNCWAKGHYLCYTWVISSALTIHAGSSSDVLTHST